MPRFIYVIVSLFAATGLVSAGAYVLARWYAIDGLARASAQTLQLTLWALGGACAYAMMVGVYHVFLSITGLDRERTPRPEVGAYEGDPRHALDEKG